MLYHLLYGFAEYFSPLNVFKYLTFRTGGALMTALIISFIIGPHMIKWLKSKQPHGQPIRNDGPQSHLLTKVGTPTMGGMMILVSLSISTLLWVDLFNPFIWIVLGITLSFGLIGLYDDFLKLTKKNTKGLKGKHKLLIQALLSLIAILAIQLQHKELSGLLVIPFLKETLIDLGWFYIPFGICVMIGASNAVNLTDGLDGLAIMPVIIVAGCFLFISYLSGNKIFAEYLQIHFISGTGELAIFCGALIGAGIGFLWFNAPPAAVFMGDTGSLSAGGAIGTISLITKHELVLVVMGGLFVIEAISVILQVASFRLTGKRIFRMAPLHHHFELKGWSEATIVIRFWIIAGILALIGLSSLKIR